MKAVVWHGTEDVRVDEVPDPTIQEPTDAIVRITSTAICGSDLHLYKVLSMYMEEGDILGHEPMGIVEEVGSEVKNVKPGDRVVLPFNIACGHCFMCEQSLQSQCETTQVREQGKGAALFGYTKLYGQVAGGQAEYLRVPQAQYGPIKVPEGPADERFLYLSDVIPDRLAGRQVRRHAEGRHARRLRARPDRPVLASASRSSSASSASSPSISSRSGSSSRASPGPRRRVDGRRRSRRRDHGPDRRPRRRRRDRRSRHGGARRAGSGADAERSPPARRRRSRAS